MGLKNTIFVRGVRAFEAMVRCFGARAYWKFMPRFVETIDVVYPVHVGGKVIKMHCAGEIARVRAESFLTKEPETIAWIDHFADDDVLLDIGANVGVFTLYAALSRGLRAIAVEPAAANFHALVANVQMNGLGERVYPINAAAGERTEFGTVRIHDVSGLMGGSGLMTSDGDVTQVGWAAATPQCRLLCVRIDDLLRFDGAPFPNHIKMDVIGTQNLIIRGAEETLADPRLKSAMLEYPNAVDTDAVADQAREISDLMARKGFVADGRFVPSGPSLNRFFRRA